MRVSLVVLALLGATTLPWGSAAPHPNILLIMVDDLRTNLGSYGDTVSVTPYMDSIARAGVRFDKAYTQVRM